MKGLSFFQIRPNSPWSPAELACALQQTILSLYPGSVREDGFAAVHSPAPGFYVSRSEGLEVIRGCVWNEPLTEAALEDLRAQTSKIEAAVRGFRPGVRNVLFFVFAPRSEEPVFLPLESFSAAWTFFEYYFLQTENEEGIALRKYERAVLPERSAAPQERVPLEPQSAPVLAPSPKRLSSDELNALIDISLALELRSRGLNPEQAAL